LYVAQCNPNFTIQSGAEIAFIAELIRHMTEQSFINEIEANELTNSAFTTIAEFLNAIKDMISEDDYNIIIEYLYVVSSTHLKDLFAATSNPKGCAKVYYKPNNPQFAQQGGVSSSTRILKLNVDTISKTAAQNQRLKGTNLVSDLIHGAPIFTPFVYKDKAPSCNPATYSGNPFFFQGQHQNSRICNKRS